MKNTGVNLHVIGCGNAFSDGGRLQTCFHVQAPEGTFLIDCGASSIAALKKQGFDLNKIDTVLISHFHGDHYGGLPYLLLEAAVFGRQAPLTIISPPGGRRKLAALLDLLYPGTEVLEQLDIRFLAFSAGADAAGADAAGEDTAGANGAESAAVQPYGSILDAGYLQLQVFPVTHAPATLPHGFRIITGEKVIAYSGDTCWNRQLIPLAENADLFICECNFFSTASEVHLDYQTLIRQLPGISCKQVLLTHLGAEMLQQLDLVKLPCAEDGMQINI